jgi:perosamine synthetase
MEKRVLRPSSRHEGRPSGGDVALAPRIPVRERAPSDDFVPFHRPSIGQAEIDAVVGVLRSGWLTTGQRALELEGAFARRLGVPHAIAVSSCTAALHLALSAAGVGPGDEVIVPTFTFAATAEAVVYLGARPVLADVDPVDGLLRADEVARRLGPRTRAVMPVHLAGLPCDLDAIGAAVAGTGAVVIDDAAHALPARLGDRSIGAIGDATAFSFYATKNLTTAEGGMITTSRDDWADAMRRRRLHGMSRDAWRRYAADGQWAYDITELGWKYNLPDVLAAIGLAQLPRLDAFHDARRDIVARYRAGLGDIDGLALPAERSGTESAWHLFIVRLALDRLRIDRAAVAEALRARGVGTSVHFIPLHRHSHYRRLLGASADAFPGAEDLHARCLSLPLYPDLRDDEVDRVIGAVREVLAGARR